MAAGGVLTPRMDTASTPKMTFVKTPVYIVDSLTRGSKVNKRRIKKAYRKAMEGIPLAGRENTAVFNGRGDFKKKMIKQLRLEWWLKVKGK